MKRYIQLADEMADNGLGAGARALRELIDKNQALEATVRHTEEQRDLALRQRDEALRTRGGLDA